MPSPELKPLPEKRILIVDDEPEIREGYKAALAPQPLPKLSSSRIAAAPATPAQSEGPTFNVTEAENGEQALEIFKRAHAEGRPFACAIVDVRMPGKLDGLQFIREAWKVDPDTRMVVATAYQDRSVNEIDRFFGEEFQDHWDYLSKPFTAGEIIQKARQLTSSWARQLREREYLRQIEAQQATLVTQERLAAVGRLARSVGHEFGNVLQPLITKLELAHEAATSPEQKESLGEMLEAAVLGANICQDLLTFSREAHGSQGTEAPAAALPFSQVVEKSLRLLRHELKKKDIQVTQEVGEGNVRGNESRLVQVVVNLCTNSIHAMKAGGQLALRGGQKGDQFHLEITDNGTGIKPEDLAHIFEPLFSTKGAQGNGLGLSVVKQIVESFGGQISITSNPGQGTQAHLDFPINH